MIGGRQQLVCGGWGEGVAGSVVVSKMAEGGGRMWVVGVSDVGDRRQETGGGGR